MSVTDNRDLNDDFVQYGSDVVRGAIRDARDNLPPFAPYDEPEEARATTIKASPFVWRPTEEIPPRQWLYGRHLIRKFLSLDIAAGGIGKSSLKIVEALAMVTNRPFLGKAIEGGPLTVWLYNLEDPADETERRIHAAMHRFDVGPNDLGGRLYSDTGRDQPLCIAEELDSGVRIVRPVVDSLVSEITERGIDVLTVDPFVSSHEVSENDNGKIDKVAKEWSRIADRCNCSINLVHHIRKQNGTEVTAESSRGAVSLIQASRSVIVYNRMTKEEGERAGIAPDQRGFYFRTQNDKANLAPPEAADWHRMNNVDLPNGDAVGVACPWEWPDPFDGVTTRHLKLVQELVGNGDWRLDVRSRESWVGCAIAKVLELDPAKHAGKIKDILKQWIETDMLRVVEKDDERRRPKQFVEVGIWHTD